MSRTGTGARALAGAALLACALLAAAAMAVPSAYANREIAAPTMPDGSAMTVSDDATRIQVDKLDEATHAAVKGARMQIVERDTGEVVDEWTTDGTVHELEKALDVGTVYVLREAQAPEGYSKIQDVEFFAKEVEGEGIGLLAERDDVALTGAYRVALYEPREAAVVTQDKVVNRGGIAATGDGLALIAGIAATAAAGAAIALVAARRRSRGGKGE